MDSFPADSPTSVPADSVPESNEVYNATQRVEHLSRLLGELDEVQPLGAKQEAELQHQDRLADIRLGMASGLFRALRVRHPQTAAHSLRVALGCSSWLDILRVPEAVRDTIEIAALLHDVGKIGVPDAVLYKPRPLEGEEILLMEQHRRVGYDILSSCCNSLEIPQLIHYAGAWYDGRKHGFDRQGDDLPLGSRLIAILDAYDSMVTDHVYRPAMSRDRALNELFEHAGSQFDPRMVQDFCQLLTSNQVRLDSVARRWLQQLDPRDADSKWALGTEHALPGVGSIPSVVDSFHLRLLESMHDGVIFVDSERKILKWNRAAERLTGMAASTMESTLWAPDAVQLKDERGKVISEATCPVLHTIASKIMTMQRVTVVRRNRPPLSINLQVVPVSGADGRSHGVAVVMHDASTQSNLEERVQTLRKKATQDPLTKVANRAEFDRALAEFVDRHLELNTPFSLIICDIDFFKRINDEHGHQAGDEALINFAALLRSHAREGDVVARYGGEEFVLICEGCDNQTATQRAEEIRKKLASLAQPMLNHRTFTASFGVSELQPGDSAELILNRADRALLQAKDLGRNRVVQLGAGMGDAPPPAPAKKRWFDWFQEGPPELTVERQLVTAVPIKLAAEKLRGFIADHSARLVQVEGDQVVLEIGGHKLPQRRRGDRPITFVMQLGFREARVKTEGRGGGSALRTVLTVSIHPKRKRDRRQRNIEQRALQLLVSLKSYFVAHEIVDENKLDESGVLQKAKHVLGHWLND